MEKMEGKKNLNDETASYMSARASYMSKIKRAAKLLFYQRHRKPGVKGWELKKALGKDYLKIIRLLNEQLENIDLQIKTVYEGIEHADNPTEDQLERARFYITLKDPLHISDMTMSGWRVDDVACLVVAIAFIISKQGKASRKEVEKILEEKFPKWRVGPKINRFIKQGYLGLSNNDVLYLDWRSRAEVEQRELVKLILGKETKTE